MQMFQNSRFTFYCFLFILGSCKSTPTISGKDIYLDNCITCHTAKDNSTAFHPTILEMNKLSSDSLYVTLTKIRRDSTHSYFMKQFSKKEINSLVKYLKDYYKKQY